MRQVPIIIDTQLFVRWSNLTNDNFIRRQPVTHTPPPALPQRLFPQMQMCVKFCDDISNGITIHKGGISHTWRGNRIPGFESLRSSTANIFCVNLIPIFKSIEHNSKTHISS